MSRPRRGSTSVDLASMRDEPDMRSVGLQAAVPGAMSLGSSGRRGALSVGVDEPCAAAPSAPGQRLAGERRAIGPLADSS